jgi:hypothetical protein
MRLSLLIRAYEVDGLVDHFDDGSIESFDLIKAEILTGERAGQMLSLFVESNSPLAERWNRPGETLTVSIEPERLEAQMLFAAAFTIEGEP